jgi:hypothetical protein
VTPSLFSLIVFASVFIGAMLGMLFGPMLPPQHADSDSRDAVRRTMALVAMMVALVLGLLVASAKSFYDTQNNEVTQLAANAVLLDGVLAHYGPEAADTRGFLRDDAARWLQLMHPGAGLRQRELLLDKIQELSPKDDNQRTMKAQACNLAIQMGQVRWLMFAQNSIPVPKVLLLVLIFWLTVLFFSFGLFAPHNFTVRTGLFVSALAVAGAIFLILEMYQPHSGFIQVSDAPLRAALAQLGQL